MANKQNQVRCPVCRQFTGEKQAAAYEWQVKDLKAKVENLARWNHERAETIQQYKDEYEDLMRKYGQLREELDRLKRRNWWQRLRNL